MCLQCVFASMRRFIQSGQLHNHRFLWNRRTLLIRYQVVGSLSDGIWNVRTPGVLSLDVRSMGMLGPQRVIAPCVGVHVVRQRAMHDI